jgi:glutaminyl-tRNA synthetase
MDPAKKEALIRLGLESAMKTLEKSAAVPDLILQAAEAANISSASPTVGALLLAAATDIKEADKTALRAFVFSYIASERLLNKAQVTAACAYLKAAKVSAAGDINVAEFDRACGAGVRFSDEEIRGRVREVLGRHAEELRTARYTFPIMDVLREMKEGDGGWGWADGGKMKAALDAEVLELLGPKNADDEKMIADIFAAKKAAAKEKDKAAAAGAGAGGKGTAAVAGAGAGSAVSPAATPAASPAPGAGAAATASGEPSSPFVARELTSAINSPALLEEHRRVTGGKIRTRFPPEPNGFLHVGHAKSMNLNFEGAFLALGKDPKTDGETIFRCVSRWGMLWHAAPGRTLEQLGSVSQRRLTVRHRARCSRNCVARGGAYIRRPYA